METPTKERKTYSLDIKIYEAANIYECPFPLPEKMSDSKSNFKLGTHTVEVHWEPGLMEEFSEWCHTHGSIIKLLGSEKLD